jgi:molybdopterin synthase catalytic subunit
MVPRELTISEAPVVPADYGTGQWGAELRFLGIVRGTEQEAEIAGIHYTAYLPMAQQVLEKIVQEMQDQHGAHPIQVHHRLGWVPVGQASLIITTAGKHSAETFARLSQYLHRIKTELPVWKEFPQ